MKLNSFISQLESTQTSAHTPFVSILTSLFHQLQPCCTSKCWVQGTQDRPPCYPWVGWVPLLCLTCSGAYTCIHLLMMNEWEAVTLGWLPLEWGHRAHRAVGMEVSTPHSSLEHCLDFTQIDLESWRKAAECILTLQCCFSTKDTWPSPELKPR